MCTFCVYVRVCAACVCILRALSFLYQGVSLYDLSRTLQPSASHTSQPSMSPDTSSLDPLPSPLSPDSLAASSSSAPLLPSPLTHNSPRFAFAFGNEHRGVSRSLR